MAELKDKTLEQINAGSNWIDKHKKQIEEWESHSKSPIKEISDPLLPGADIPDELLDKITGAGENSGWEGESDSVDPLRSTSPEEELGGRVIVVPTDEVMDAGL